MEYTKTVTVKRTYNVDFFRTRLTAPWEILSSSANAWGFPHMGLKPVSFVAGIWP